MGTGTSFIQIEDDDIRHLGGTGIGGGTLQEDYILIGNLSTLPQCREIFNGMEALYEIRFHIPPYSEYRTALGAALSYIDRQTGIKPL